MKNYKQFLNEKMDKSDPDYVFIKNSKLKSILKKEILENIEDANDNGDNEIVCHLDNCIEFLNKQGIETDNMTKEEDAKLENYLRQYFYDNIKGFKRPIMTEDYIMLYDPKFTPNYKPEDFPNVKPNLMNDKKFYQDLEWEYLKSGHSLEEMISFIGTKTLETKKITQMLDTAVHGGYDHVFIKNDELFNKIIYIIEHCDKKLSFDELTHFFHRIKWNLRNEFGEKLYLYFIKNYPEFIKIFDLDEIFEIHKSYHDRPYDMDRQLVEPIDFAKFILNSKQISSKLSSNTIQKYKDTLVKLEKQAEEVKKQIEVLKMKKEAEKYNL